MLDSRSPAMLRSENRTLDTGRILIVDDDHSFLTFASDVFGAAGLQYEIAITGTAAINGLLTRRFNAALVDLLLPDFDGLAILDSTKAMTHRPPIILISGAGTIPSVVTAMRLGAAGFLEKPVSPSDLLDTVRSTVMPVEMPESDGPWVLPSLVRDLLWIIKSPVDVPNIDSWIHLAGTSRGVLFSRCSRTRVGAKALLDLGRLLRVVLMPTGSKRELELLLDSRDIRTIHALLSRAGLTAHELMQCSPEEFLLRQRLFEHPDLIDALHRQLQKRNIDTALS